MKNSVLLAQVLLCLVVQAAPVENESIQETLGAFVGEWNMELFTDSETFGDRGGPGTGTMVCDWGPMQVWVDCELDSRYEGLGRYVLKVVLYRNTKDGSIGAFVTNSFGGGRLYKGHWETPGKLVYVDAWLDPQRNWEHQRVVYTFEENGEMSYAIEVSSNGTDYLPHSRDVYRRK